MYKLLQLSTYGMKNIEREITINFSNETIKNGITKINNVNIYQSLISCPFNY